MADIEKSIIDNKKEIEIINKQLKENLNIEKKAALIEKKNLLVDQKMELNKLLIQYNNILNHTTNYEKPTKRKTENIPESEDMSKSSDEENIIVAKNIKGERKYKKARKKNDTDNNTHDGIIKENNKEASDSNIHTKLIKKSRNKSAKNKLINKITEEKIIESFNIGKNYDFNKYNILYSWLEEEFITTHTKKKESSVSIFLVCSKRGSNINQFNGKTKYNKETGEVVIYEKCDNTNNTHIQMNFEIFKKEFILNKYDKIDMNIKLFQKYYIKRLMLYNNIKDYTEAQSNFQDKFKDTKFIINENIYRKIISDTYGTINRRYM